ncbi:MAG: histidine phosphatase family protein [Candidatus Melainabacteria bacterium]|nr:histidine phosphatase family protein [Candidatus Melainabacteria bacterium]
MLPLIYLARHGETAWSLTGQHTGLTDIALTENGEQQAIKLGTRLKGLKFANVFCSPLQRARRTGELAGFGAEIEVLDNLSEWHYGAYEGLTTNEILKTRPDFVPFRDGFPQGEAVEEIGARADLVVQRLKAETGSAMTNILIFSHGHMLRFVAARFLNLPSSDARIFNLATASISILGFDHNLTEPVIKLWNDDRHLL